MKAKIVYGWVVDLRFISKWSDEYIDHLAKKNLIHPIDPANPYTRYIIGIITQTCGSGGITRVVPCTDLYSQHLKEERLDTIFANAPALFLILDSEADYSFSLVEEKK